MAPRIPRVFLLDQVDSWLDRCGVKYVFIESGDASILNKCEEIGINYSPEYKFWCELSWGSGVHEEDEFDFAFNGFGKSLGEAMLDCMNAFVESQSEQVLRAKEKYGWRI